MRAQLEKPVLDCPDPRDLARFYAELLGMRTFEESDEWVVLGREPGMRELAFQKADPWVEPRWPDPDHPLVHLDIRVDDVHAAERVVLAAGATRAPGTSESGYRVFRDPVGHPFCLTYGPSPRPDPRMDFDTSRPTESCRGAQIGEGLAVRGEEVAQGRAEVDSWLQRTGVAG